jgi:hypothetical protein
MRTLTAVLLSTLLACHAAAVKPLTGGQLHNVCKAHLEASMSVEGQICGYYILGFLDGSEATHSSDFCVGDEPLLEVMHTLRDDLVASKELKHRANLPARDTILHLLREHYPCPN